MFQTRFLAVAVFLLGTAFDALAQNPPPLFGAGGQPPKGQPGMFGRPNVQLKGLGKQAEQTPQQQAGFWVDKLVSDLEQLKADLGGVRLQPAARKALNDAADACIALALGVEKSLGQNNRNQWYRAYADLDKGMEELGKAIAQHVGKNIAVELSLSRAGYASEQLGAALTVGDNANQQQMRQSILHMAASLEQQSERLRSAIGELPGAGQNLERAAGQFARNVAKFNANLNGNANLDQARKELAVIGNQWNELAAVIGAFPNLPAPVQFQANRVDGLYRRLAELLGVVPPQPPVPPMPPPYRRVSVLAVGADAGMEPRVVVYGDDKGTVVNSFYAYNRQLHRNGVRVSVADLNGDGLPEIVTINGGQGHARVKVFDGRDANLLLTFDGFDNKITQFGYFVAAADLSRDGRALVAIAPDVGGPPAVEVYDLAQGKLLGTVQPFPRNFDGGVRLAWGDVNADGIPDLMCASGPGKIASSVKVYDGSNFTKILGDYLGADPKYTGGLWVAAADLTKNNRAEIVVGLDAGHAPSVRVFSGRDGKFIGEMEPFPNNFRGGVRVAVGDPDDNNNLKVICAPGPGGQNLPIKVFTLKGTLHSELDPFPRSNKGMFVGSR